MKQDFNLERSAQPYIEIYKTVFAQYVGAAIAESAETTRRGRFALEQVTAVISAMLTTADES